ncbi:MAG: hypothetical protein AB7D47_13480 [Desulfovibrio sp.]
MEKTRNKQLPTVKAYRNKTHENNHSLVFKCPVCGGVHSHGISAQSGFGESDGPRISHCRFQQPRKRTCAPGVFLEDYNLQETTSRKEAGFF